MSKVNESKNEVVKLLETFELSREHLDTIEAYLKGEVELEAVEAFEAMEFTAKMSNVAGTFESLLERKMRSSATFEQAARYFNVYRAVLGKWVNLWIGWKIYPLAEMNPYIDKKKLLAMMAGNMSRIRENVASEGDIMKRMYALTKGDVQLFLEAISSSTEEASTKCILQSYYLFYKYYDQQVEFVEHDKLDGKSIPTLESAFGKFPVVEMEEEDMAILTEVEETLRNALAGSVDKAWEEDRDITREQQANRLGTPEFSFEDLSNARTMNVKDGSRWDLAMGLSYINYQLSETLKDMVTFCCSMDAARALRVIRATGNHDGHGKLDYIQYGLGYDVLFHIKAKDILADAVQTRNGSQPILKKVLEHHFVKNQDSYMAFMKKQGQDIYKVMADLVGKHNPEIMKSLEEDLDEISKEERREAIKSVLPNYIPDFRLLLSSYLNGESDVSILFDFWDVKEPQYYGYFGRRSSGGRMDVESYVKRHHDSKFLERLEIVDYLFFGYNHNRGKLAGGRTIEKDLVNEKFDMLEAFKVPTKFLVRFANKLKHDYYHIDEAEWNALFQPRFYKYFKANREELKEAFDLVDVPLAVAFYGSVEENICKELLTYRDSSEKKIRDDIYRIIVAHPEWKSEVLPCLSDKKQGGRGIAISALCQWVEKDKSLVSYVETALAAEKSAKFKTMLEDALAATSVGGDDVVAKVQKKANLEMIKWLYDGDSLPTVHMLNGEEASEEYMKAICLYFATLESYGVSEVAMELAKDLNQEELSEYTKYAFDVWLADGAVAKQRWILYMASVFGGEFVVDLFKDYIKEWTDNSRGAMAAEAVQALAYNPAGKALPIIYNISKKFNNKMVKAAAQNALEVAAKTQGMTVEELADYIVPNYDFDATGRRVFDYGNRSFTVSINLAGELEIIGDDGKKVKNMPAPGAKDDEVLAAEAYSAFKVAKKGVKDTIKAQKARLEQNLATGRLWKMDAWKRLFVENGVMHSFAIGLVWGIYEDGKVVDTFRFMEDGTYTNKDQDEWTMPEEAKIGLVHPIDISAEDIEVWMEQLKDYEIKQPIEQLSREIYLINEEEKMQKSLERFGGIKMNSRSLNSKLTGMFWNRGLVEEGYYYEYFNEDKEQDIGVSLNFSGICVYMEDTQDDPTIFDARFYKPSKWSGNYYKGERIGNPDAMLMGEVPARYFSEIVLQLSKATETSGAINSDWRLKHRY